MSSPEHSARLAVVQAARRLGTEGLNKGSSGNVSLRFGEDGFLVTPSGMVPEAFGPEHVVLVRWDGTWNGEWKPSSEWRFHRDILAQRPDMNAVVHCHSPAATALAVLGRALPQFHYMVGMAGGRDVRCAPYATYGTQDLSDHAVKAMEGRRACLLAHHGMLACGLTLDRAIGLAVEIEHLADIYLRLLPLGEPPRLPDDEMDRVLEKLKGYGADAQGRKD